MNIEGLDYNTQREKLVMPEYGREVQSMIDYAVTLEDKEERKQCATAIVAIMERMFPQSAGTADFRQKLWDHLAIMSGFKLDIDYPCGQDNRKAGSGGISDEEDTRETLREHDVQDIRQAQDNARRT